MNQISGIYQICNNENGKVYIGSAVNLKRRMACHFSKLKEGDHHNRYLQHAWNKSRGQGFFFGVLEYVKKINQLIIREQYYIDTIRPEYNISLVAGSSLGIKRSEAFKRKVSEYQKGNKRWLGKKHTIESRQKMSKAKKEKKLGENNHNSKLTLQQVIEIREKIFDKVIQCHIAKEYGVSPTLITNIKERKTWKHL